jgi:Glycoside-hydrolase family GH114
MRLAWTALLAVTLAACEGTEGTLLTRPSGAASVGNEPVDDLFLPAEDARWLARLDGAVDIEAAADFFYLDPQQQPAADLAQLHAQRRHYVCYLSAGTLESFRDDASQFPDRVIGNVTSNFPNERWLDVRDAEVRALMAQRIAALADAGCDGVTPASLTGYAEDSGFALSLADTVDYARFLAEELHAAGISAGLTGPSALVAELWQSFDFGLAISCVQGSQCAEYAPLRAANKPVLYVELGDEADAPQLCKSANELGFNAIVSDAGFTGRCVVCRDIL